MEVFDRPCTRGRIGGEAHPARRLCAGDAERLTFGRSGRAVLKQVRRRLTRSVGLHGIYRWPGQSAEDLAASSVAADVRRIPVSDRRGVPHRGALF